MKLPDSLTQIAHSRFSPKEFDTVHLTAWVEVFKKIESIFIKKYNSNTKFNWWWENLKDDTLSVQFPENDGYQYLHQLINPNEKIFFVVCDQANNPTKQWIYEGTIAPIQFVLDNISRIEYYLVSKKYEWMLAENHHHYLIAAGNMKNSLRQFAMSRNLSYDQH
ncbi:MAG: hypothetical protein J7578_06060 [Chitinophagaceae bacterium]|nr:hypothetical protein [Chitinophagaceae bacterium]